MGLRIGYEAAKIDQIWGTIALAPSEQADSPGGRMTDKITICY